SGHFLTAASCHDGHSLELLNRPLLTEQAGGVGLSIPRRCGMATGSTHASAPTALSRRPPTTRLASGVISPRAARSSYSRCLSFMSSAMVGPDKVKFPHYQTHVLYDVLDQPENKEVREPRCLRALACRRGRRGEPDQMLNASSSIMAIPITST